MASNPYSLAQDAASEIRLFQGEYWYDVTRGIPYFAQIFGKTPPIELIKAQAVAAAEMVPEVSSAACFIASVSNRNITGQVQVTSTSGQTANAGFIQ
jgi:hypothetical protein